MPHPYGEFIDRSTAQGLFSEASAIKNASNIEILPVLDSFPSNDIKKAKGVSFYGDTNNVFIFSKTQIDEMFTMTSPNSQDLDTLVVFLGSHTISTPEGDKTVPTIILAPSTSEEVEDEIILETPTSGDPFLETPPAQVKSTLP